MTICVHLPVFCLHQCIAKQPPGHSIELFVWFALGLGRVDQSADIQPVHCAKTCLTLS